MDVIDPAIPLAEVDPLGYSPRSVIRGDDSANGVADDPSVRILKEKEGRECEGFRVGVTHQEKGECEGGGDVLRSECIGNVEFWSVQGRDDRMGREYVAPFDFPHTNGEGKRVHGMEDDLRRLCCGTQRAKGVDQRLN